MLTPIEQIQCHEDQVLKMYNMHIMTAPSSLDSQLVGRMISISFRCNYTVVFTKKKSQKVFFLFDVGKIISVESGISNKFATIKVDYDENGGICKVDIRLNDYVLDEVKNPKKCYQWRLLEL